MVEAAARSAAAGSRLGDELAVHWAGGGGADVYDRPDAFTRFVRGGGNVGLYEELSGALARGYEAATPESLLDIGCGDGLALAPALARSAHTPARIDVVEPSAALLDAARAKVPGAHAWQGTAQRFFATRADRRWDAVQATFSLRSVPPEDRVPLLQDVRARSTRLTIADFDVPSFVEGTWAHPESLVSRYERGIAEYGDDASLVAQGFLLPVLLGQVAPRVARTDWEQPAERWVGQLGLAGYRDVVVAPLADYWWAPAVLITAE